MSTWTIDENNNNYYPSSTKANLALYHYDFHIKSAKFAATKTNSTIVSDINGENKLDKTDVPDTNVDNKQQNKLELVGDSVQQSKNMADYEFLRTLRGLVSVGDPNLKYSKIELIGEGLALILMNTCFIKIGRNDT